MRKIFTVLLLIGCCAAWAGDFEEGVIAFQKLNYANAERLFKLAVAQGNVNAQNHLGKMFRIGQGVPQNYSEAARLYKLSAAQGSALGQTNLGVLYSKGQGVPKDYAESVRLTKLAAEQGYASAQNNLGNLYRIGQGVLQDYTKAHMWLNLASANGSEEAIKNRNEVANLMTLEQIAMAQKLAQSCQIKNFKNCN